MGEKRIDPPSRPVDGDINDQVEIVNRDPNRVYRLASPNNLVGVDLLTRYGFVVETSRKDGPRILGGPTAADGAALTFMGDVLMSAPVEVERKMQERARKTADNYQRAVGSSRQDLGGGIYSRPWERDGMPHSDEYVERMRS